MTTQLHLIEMPTTCARLDCEAPPTHMLIPSFTGHCEAHESRSLRDHKDSWGEAFREGKARIVEL